MVNPIVLKANGPPNRLASPSRLQQTMPTWPFKLEWWIIYGWKLSQVRGPPGPKVINSCCQQWYFNHYWRKPNSFPILILCTAYYVPDNDRSSVTHASLAILKASILMCGWQEPNSVTFYMTWLLCTRERCIPCWSVKPIASSQNPANWCCKTVPCINLQFLVESDALTCLWHAGKSSIRML